MEKPRTKKPGVDEPICLISYRITHILLGGGPDTRSSFWKMYHHELSLNRKTEYRNYHTHLCRQYLLDLATDGPVYFRNNRLTIEKEASERLKTLAHVATSFDS